MSDSLGALAGTQRVLIAVGPGGVGKTSTSAALAMEGARQGRRTVVLTIDPARRLANALGLPEIGNVEREVSAEAFRAANLEPPAGKLTAMMLDIKQSWDEVVRRYHPDPERRERLLQNRFYVALSSALAGSQEYMAMEKLHELATRETDRPDLIVLDTPPSANAIDFLEAPNRMIDALDNDATRWLIEPFAARRKRSGRFFDVGSSVVIRSIGKFTGVETLEALADLLICFHDMFDGFRQRARATQAILGDARTRFLIVSAPRPGPLADAEHFRQRLIAEKLPLGAFVLNRATPDPFSTTDALPSEETPEGLATAVAQAGGRRGLAERLHANARAQSLQAGQERSRQGELARTLGDVPVYLVPELAADVHSLVELDALRLALTRAAPGVPRVSADR